MALPEIRYARNGDVSIAYQIIGEGPLDLVHVTGFVSHLEVAWESPLIRAFFRRVATFCRVILWDKREQGLSDRLGQPPTLEQGMDDLRAVMDAAGSDRAALLGISEGGPLSILFAASFPERVSHLILYGTYARVTRADDYPVGVPREEMERWLNRVVQRWGGPVGIELFAPSVAGDEEFASWWMHLLRSGTSPRAALDLMRMYLDIDVRPAMPAVTAPTLILQRSGDQVASVASGRALAAMLPHARYVELPGEDHLGFVLVRRELTRYRGREIKHTGDGFLASFDGPVRAVECAAAITQGVRRLGLEVRAGVADG